MNTRWVKRVMLVLGLLMSLHSQAQSINAPSVTSPNNDAMSLYFNNLCGNLLKNLGLDHSRVTIQAATQQGQDDLVNTCGNFLQSSGAQRATFVEGLDPTGFV